MTRPPTANSACSARPGRSPTTASSWSRDGRGARPGQVLLRTLWLSFDPAQRGWLNDIPSYIPPVGIGEVMRASGVGEVVASEVTASRLASLVHAIVGWQTYALLDPSTAADIEPCPTVSRIPKMMLSVAGITGLTAYFGMTESAGQPRATPCSSPPPPAPPVPPPAKSHASRAPAG